MPAGMPDTHLTAADLAAGLATIRESSREEGRLEMIVSRPDVGTRQVLDEGVLDLAVGLVGDSWSGRRGTRTSGGAPHPDMQLNVMNARVIALLAQDRSRWPLAGDQLFVDLDLGGANLPPGTQLVIGDAAIEVSAEPHTGCGKFVTRFGAAAATFVNSPEGRALRLRGINAKVVRPGRIRTGDRVVKRAPGVGYAGG
jgi:hypothetical protein